MLRIPLLPFLCNTTAVALKHVRSALSDSVSPVITYAGTDLEVVLASTVEDPRRSWFQVLWGCPWSSGFLPHVQTDAH